MAQNRTPNVRSINCPLCEGWGFRLPLAIDRQFKTLIPFAILFEQASPCGCKAGALFLADKNRYFGLTPNRAPVVPINTRTA